MTARVSRRAILAAAALAVVAGIVAAAVGATHHLSSASSSESSSVPAPVTISGGFPDVSSTGVPAGVVLKRVPQDIKAGPGWHATSDGSVHIDALGAVLDGLDIWGSVQNDYNSLTVKNTRIRCVGENDWCVALGDHSVLTDTDIGGGADGHTIGHAIAVYSGDTNAGNLIQRVNIHHQVHGLRVDGGTTLLDSFIHDLPMGDPVLTYTAGTTGTTGTDYHSDGLMTTRGGNTIVRHNRFEGGNTANLFVQADVTDSTARIGSYLVENNLFINIAKNGQVCSWGVAIENKGINGTITVRNNTFNHGWQVGPIETPPGATVTGNTYTDGTPAN